MKIINQGKNIYFFLIIGVVLATFLIITEIKSVSKESTKVDTSGWKTYHNQQMGFSIQYPSGSDIKEANESIRIDLPFTPGTTLSQKYLKIIVQENIPSEKCTNPLQTIINERETVRIGGIGFKKEIGSDVAASNIYDSISYSTFDKGRCFGLSFILHHASPGVFSTPPPAFDRDKETENFEQIVATFQPT